jgi:uncharacterized lipoprotein YddW (UPF0748 family)
MNLMTRYLMTAAILICVPLAALGQSATPASPPSAAGVETAQPATPLTTPAGATTVQPTTPSPAQAVATPATQPPVAQPATQPPLAIALDDADDGVGIAQQTARAKGLQARIMWIDAGANVGNLNSAEKIQSVIDHIKQAGFNMIVLDVKPIVGDTIYPSAYAPRLIEWKGMKTPVDLDVLRTVLDDAHGAGLTVYANMSTFGEGHKFVKRGPAYTNPSWQTTMYLSDRWVKGDGWKIAMSRIDAMPADERTVAAITQESLLRGKLNGYTVAVLNFDARVQGIYEPAPTSSITTITPMVPVEASSSGSPQPMSGGSAASAPAVPATSPATAGSVTGGDLAIPSTSLLAGRAGGAGLPPISLPPRGFAIVGRGAAGKWIAAHALVGQIMLLGADPDFVPIANDNSGKQLYTIYCDPNNADVRKHELDIVREVVTRYDVDGVIFDDRLRYAGLNADFGEPSRKAFESYIGHKLKWPDDVYRDSVFPGNPPDIGPYYSDWLVWRAQNITSWLAEAATAIRGIRPAANVSVYVGSWYGQYDEVGSNWAAPDFDGPFAWDTPAFRGTGYAGLLDWLTTGCYYEIPNIAQAVHDGDSAGATVEAAGQLSNRVVNDAAWTYAGLYALTYQNHVAAFQKSILAAEASSQGVMIFDLSQIIDYNWWDAIAQAFGAGPVPVAPNTVPGLLDIVRSQHAADVAAGKPEPPLPAYQGVSGTGW